MKACEFSELWFYLGVSIWKKCEWIDKRMFLGFNGMDKAGILFIYLFFLRVLLRFWGKWFKILFWGFNGIDKAGLFLFFSPLHALQRFWGKWFTILKLKLAFEYVRDGVRNFSRLSWDGAWIPFLLPASIRMFLWFSCRLMRHQGWLSAMSANWSSWNWRGRRLTGTSSSKLTR